ncbi:aminotransferase class V-fold PLP-dependent enzyme [Marinivivus vitaminiproducens]|uniref:aminotransferase class V-fold PLP-dependent enzyme n=1 Tax=Marinivivus vitaminiproducens TaxID=3035935 RepID=UPI00279BDE86|nr:aminotransferase class V-fold PLP-dependent enzyme [Geminicoccaceae bacterium SCSIO 64248]
MLPCQRHLFDLPDDIAYLNCAAHSPLAHAVVEAGGSGLRQKVRPWAIGREHFFELPETARALYAELIGADADGIAIVPAASYGLATAAANLSIGPGRDVLILAEDFPSNVHTWRAQAARSGAAVVTVARPADDDWTEAVLARLDERIAVAALPNVHWTDGGLLDLARIGERCRALGAALVLDTTQSTGALPLDLDAVRPDFMVAAGYKWLMGPYSLGYLYVAPHRRDGRPLEQNWIAREGSEDFASLIDYRDAYQPGARRFDVGERANFALVPASIAALEMLRDWSVPAVAATLAGLTAGIAERAAALGLASAPAHRRCGHFLGLRFPDAPPPDILARLAEAGVHVSVRGRSLRVSPHVYNTQDDVDRLIGALARLVG